MNHLAPGQDWGGQQKKVSDPHAECRQTFHVPHRGWGNSIRLSARPAEPEIFPVIYPFSLKCLKAESEKSWRALQPTTQFKTQRWPFALVRPPTMRCGDGRTGPTGLTGPPAKEGTSSRRVRTEVTHPTGTIIGTDNADAPEPMVGPGCGTAPDPTNPLEASDLN